VLDHPGTTLAINERNTIGGADLAHRGSLLTGNELQELRRLAHNATRHPRLARRARIVLLAAAGHSTEEIAARLGAHDGTVRKWLRRFASGRLAGLRDQPRPGAPRRLRPEALARAIELLTQADGSGRLLSTRAVARILELSQTSVARLRRAVTGASRRS
jgi:transposase